MCLPSLLRTAVTLPLHPPYNFFLTTRVGLLFFIISSLRSRYGMWILSFLLRHMCVWKPPPPSHLISTSSGATMRKCVQQKLMSRLWNGLFLCVKTLFVPKKRTLPNTTISFSPPLSTLFPRLRLYVYFAKRVFKKDEIHSITPYSHTMRERLIPPHPPNHSSNIYRKNYNPEIMCIYRS